MTPENRIAKIIPIATSVRTAFRAAGSLKFVTAFEIASTPVRAEHPDEKARYGIVERRGRQNRKW